MPCGFARLSFLATFVVSIAASAQTSTQNTPVSCEAIGKKISCSLPFEIKSDTLTWPPALTFTYAGSSTATLPACLQLSNQTGVISGLPTKSCIGVYRITVNVGNNRDNGNLVATGTFVVNVKTEGLSSVTVTPIALLSQTIAQDVASQPAQVPQNPTQPQPGPNPAKPSSGTSDNAAVTIPLLGNSFPNSCGAKGDLLSNLAKCSSDPFSKYSSACDKSGVLPAHAPCPDSPPNTNAQTGTTPPFGSNAPTNGNQLTAGNPPSAAPSATSASQSGPKQQALDPNDIVCASAPDFKHPPSNIPSDLVSFALQPEIACSADKSAPPLLMSIGAFVEEKAAFRQLASVRKSPNCSDFMNNELSCRNYVCGLRLLQQLATTSAQDLNGCAAIVGAKHKKADPQNSEETTFQQKAQFWSNLAADLKKNAAAVNSGSYTLGERIADPYSVTMKTSSAKSTASKLGSMGNSPADASTPASGTERADASDAPSAPLPSGDSQEPAPYSAPRVFHRIGLGIDITGASSTDASGRIMGDLSVQLPLRRTGCPSGSTQVKYVLKPEDIPNPPCIVYTPRNWIDGLLRIDSIAQPGAVSGLSSPASYFGSAASGTPQSMVYSMEAAAGYDFGFYGDTNTARTRPYFTINMGAITPLSPTQANPTIYDLTGAIEKVYNTSAGANTTIYNTACPDNTNPADTNNQLSYVPAPTTTTPYPSAVECYVAFLPQGRNHFYRHYEAGFRLRHFSPDSKSNAEHYPAIFEAEVGQNEYVTGGMMRGWVGHFGGSTFFPGNVIHGIYLFGSMDLAFTQSSQFQSVLLETPTSPPAITAPNVAVINTPQANRDRWRLGFSMDINEVLNELSKKNKDGQ